MFALVDCNNFYASCERVFRPDLIGKPVVVLSNNDGCVIARSDEAKKAGIPMGAPAFKYQHIFDAHKVNVFSSNYALYGDMSRRVMAILATFTPDVEVYSIDEAFLRFKVDRNTDFPALSRKIKEAVTRSTGIPISVGMAETKTLAKAANRIAKKFSELTGGIYIIDSEEKRLKAIKWLKVKHIWGIGKSHTQRLNKMDVNTAYDFTLLNDGWVRKNLTVVGLRLKKDLEGQPTLDLEHTVNKKNIATTRSFDQNYTTFEQLRERVSSFAVSCAEKLRKQHSTCTRLMVFLGTNRFRSDLPQYDPSVMVKLTNPTNSAIELSKQATRALRIMFREGFEYKRAGVLVMDLVKDDTCQLNLFEPPNIKHKPLMEAIDKINLTMGQQKVKLGSQDPDRLWKMRQEKLSPRYTTRLKEIIVVKA
ncbi:Y-family DNA polymerase [Saccharicrinis sp. FJH54]|uniref:Y-family DNA polymerase n=1 Tax=Saccharicrinis sp. FJH54 TaxID=3344665 RepID=UPI0035D492DE